MKPIKVIELCIAWNLIEKLRNGKKKGKGLKAPPLISSIIKTITGEAAFVLEETFESEAKATEGTEPLTQEVTEIEVKVNNTKWKKSNE